MRMRSFLVVLAVAPIGLGAQTVRDSVITVTASRVSRVAPDRASLYVIVEGTAETAPDAVTRVETKLKTVNDAIRGFGNRVQADRPVQYSVGPTPAPNGYPGQAAPPSNLARAVIRLQVARPDQLGEVIAGLLNAGAANTSTLTFESSAIDSVRRARINDALGVAHNDAEAIATSLGGHVGPLVDVSTSAQPSFQPPQTLVFDNRFGGQTTAPEITVTTSVTARYRLVH
jgi:uncharacterized protein YggE